MGSLKQLIMVVGAVVAALGLAFGLAYVANVPSEPVARTVADDPSLPSVTIDGVTFHAETFGRAEDPTVVVLHGGPGGDYRNLLSLRSLADDGYHVVFYDQRGSGLSPRVPAEQLTFESSIADLHRIVEHYSPGAPVALLGHSWGGMMAAYYVARHPDRAARVIMAEPGVLTTEELREFARRLKPTGTLQTLWYMGGVWFEHLHVDGPDDQAAKDHLVQRMMAAPGSDNPLNVYWCDGTPPPEAREMWRVGATAMEAISRSSQSEDGQLAMPPLDTERVTQEVLFVASSCNTLIGVERQTAHLELFPNARLAVIEDAGHLMFTDQPDASLEVIRDYLQGFGAQPEPAPEPALEPH